ncbi:MAG: radical SAM protein [Anaerovoracaceae bacterium]
MKKLSRDKIIKLLNIDNGSKEYFDLLRKAYQCSRDEFHGQGYVFAQLGLNAEPCSANCRFCSFGEDHYAAQNESRSKKEDILEEAKNFIAEDVQALFLMTTADYPVEDFLDIGREVKAMMPKGMDMVCNIGDFGDDVANKLKAAGFSAAYHICRLGEGTDTDLTVEQRISTLDSIKKANLELYYCVEPIGPEHTYEQIADEIERAREYEVDVMAVMRRVPTIGTPKENDGVIDCYEFTKIAAVARLAVMPKKSMNAHETNQMTFLAGINQIYAEYGTNPRDSSLDTEKSRGMSVAKCRELLRDAGYYND